MVEPPQALPEGHRYTPNGHIVLTTGFALLISTLLFGVGPTRRFLPLWLSLNYSFTSNLR